MRKRGSRPMLKIAQNADFAQSRHPRNPEITAPWFIRPCLRHLYPEIPSLKENGFEEATQGMMPKVALYNLVDAASANYETEAERLMSVLREYAERSHYQVVEELCDFGSGEDTLRPGLSGLLDMARKKSISGILTISPSTISQNIYQLLSYREALEKYNVWLKFCDF